MHHINKIKETAPSGPWLTSELTNKEGEGLLRSGRELQRKTSWRFRPLASWVAACVLLFSPSLPLHGGWLKPDVDFSNYNVPLYDQIVNRIKAKVSARLGTGENKKDRYFIIPFAYQDSRLNPKISHSFITVIRVFAYDEQPLRTPGFKHGKYKQWNFEAFNISWMPHDFDTNPNLCVFDGFGSRIFPSLNQCSIVNGKNFSLSETLKLGAGFRNAVAMWGPYEIQKVAFDLGVKRKLLLDGGTIRYRADDRLYRKDRVAINFFHAMVGLEELYPNGGFFGTGFKMWGINGTARVLIEYTKAVRDKGLLLEPVDIKKDLYGFAYARERNSHGLYDPFPNASAYRQ
jgi:hypothetical protein